MIATAGTAAGAIMLAVGFAILLIAIIGVAIADYREQHRDD